jgi:hypothetical protein
MNRTLDQLRTATASELAAAACASGKDDDAEFLLRVAAPRAEAVERARRGQHIDVRITVLTKPFACIVCGCAVDAGTTGVLYANPAGTGAHLTCHLSRRSRRL